jgi:UDPglucose 6-dehydrogenase
VDPRGKKLAVLGLAFKGNTDDIRESPALDVIRRLLEAGASLAVYDPAAMERAKVILAPSENCAMGRICTKLRRTRTPF